MKYDEGNCYWCGKHIGEGKIAYYSLGTDTLKTTRNFCTDEHLNQFRIYKYKQLQNNRPIIPYVGREPHGQIG